jgi:DNA end-binding protein Ku
VIRKTIRSLDKVAWPRVVLISREHVRALEARDNGPMGMLLRYLYQVREASKYFDDIQEVKITKDMLDLAKHIVEQKVGHVDPSKFEDQYEAALQDLMQRSKLASDHETGVPRKRQCHQFNGCLAGQSQGQ